MLPKIQNSNAGKPELKINPEQSIQKLGSMATVVPKVKPISKKAIEKIVKKTKQSLSSISNFPAFFDFMRKENSEYHEQMEDMQRQSNARKEVRHKEVMDIIISATQNKRKADKKIKSQIKKDKVETKKEETKPFTTPAPKTEAPVSTTKVEAVKTTTPAPKVETPKTTTSVTAKPVTTAPPTVQPAPTPAPPPLPSVSTVGKTAAVTAGVVASSTALAKIKKHEGFVAKAEPDNEMNPDGTIRRKSYSVGYGHQITPQEIKQGFIQVGDEKVPVVGELGKDTVLTTKQGEILVAQDFAKFENAARAIPNFDKLNQAAQDALIDITYNMGVGWTKKFPSFMRSMQNMEFEKAADELLYTDSSKTKKTGYYTQVKGRAEQNADKIKKGFQSQPIQMQTPTQIEQKISEGSIENAEMKKMMRQSGSGQQVIIQQNFHNTTNRQHFVPPTQKQELNPTMQ